MQGETSACLCCLKAWGKGSVVLLGVLEPSPLLLSMFPRLQVKQSVFLLVGCSFEPSPHVHMSMYGSITSTKSLFPSLQLHVAVFRGRLASGHCGCSASQGSAESSPSHGDAS